MLQKYPSQQAATRAEAVRLEQKLSQLETALMTIVWNKIVMRFQEQASLFKHTISKWGQLLSCTTH